MPSYQTIAKISHTIRLIVENRLQPDRILDISDILIDGHFSFCRTYGILLISVIPGLADRPHEMERSH